MDIPAVPGNEIYDPLLRLAYHRYVSNKYLESNPLQTSVMTLNGHTGWVTCVTILPDGRLVSCSYDGTIKVWDLSKPNGQQCVATLKEHTKEVLFVTPLPGGRLASCSLDETIKLWDLGKPDGLQCMVKLNEQPTSCSPPRKRRKIV
ncbi:hypothetical protein [Salinisphaera sp. G21_0]|uniref:hypothetical protein n=1 Tax=Salinisphaera sp. G21_0 TaxID=2821094 RepID=UPI001ADC548D|nr:hypothetical protein [Salinisphaera sp. G21_0]MBO9480372.1 hypothetical protein [Salinisphaera sp. G21_0]